MGKKKPPTAKGNGRPAADKGKAAGCYVLSLAVENVRCFGPKQTLDCSDGEGRLRQWTVILGDNGTGKTTLLKSIGIVRYFGFAFKQGLLGVRSGTSSGSADVELAMGKLSELPVEQKSFSMAGEKSRDNPYTSEVWRSEQRFDETNFRGRWSLYTYDVGRGNLAIAEMPEVDRFGRQLSDFLESQVRLRDAQSWLLNLDYSSRLPDQGEAQSRLGQVKSLFVGVHPGEGVLPGISDLRFGTTSGAFPQLFVEFLTPYGWVSLGQLGHGYQTMIAWVTDFVSRMVEQYPDSKNPLAEPAVCLVDEIDLHLHPTWQRKVIAYLSERFPNTQFIVTAHSPLVVQAAASANANIAVLVRSEKTDAEGNHYVEIKNNPEDVRNWRLDQILTSDLFGGISINPPQVEELFKEKEQLLTLASPTKKQRDRLAAIEAELAKLPVGDTAREVKETNAIREAIQHLQKRSPK